MNGNTSAGSWYHFFKPGSPLLAFLPRDARWADGNLNVEEFAPQPALPPVPRLRVLAKGVQCGLGNVVLVHSEPEWNCPKRFMSYVNAFLARSQLQLLGHSCKPACWGPSPLLGARPSQRSPHV